MNRIEELDLRLEYFEMEYRIDGPGAMKGQLRERTKTLFRDILFRCADKIEDLRRPEFQSWLLDWEKQSVKRTLMACHDLLDYVNREMPIIQKTNIFTEFLTPDTHKDEFLDHLDGLRDGGLISFDGDLENGGIIILREQKAKKKYAVALYALWLEQGFISEPAKPWATLRKYVWHINYGTPTQFSPKHLSEAYKDGLFEEQLARIRGEE